MTYPLVAELAEAGIPVTVSCRVLKLARQPYYRWRNVRDALERFARAHELHAVALDRVGANLNQIARQLNSEERAHDHEVIVVLDQTQRVLRVARSYLGRDPEKMLRWLGLHELMIESEAA